MSGGGTSAKNTSSQDKKVALLVAINRVLEVHLKANKNQMKVLKREKQVQAMPRRGL